MSQPWQKNWKIASVPSLYGVYTSGVRSISGRQEIELNGNRAEADRVIAGHRATGGGRKVRAPTGAMVGNAHRP